MDINSVGREFELWHYSAVSKFLVIRSPNPDAHGQFELGVSTCLDVVFSNVGYIELPVQFESLEIAEVEDFERKRLSEQLGFAVSPKKITVILDGGRRRFVVAGKSAALEYPVNWFGHPLVPQWKLAMKYRLSRYLESPSTIGKFVDVDGLIKRTPIPSEMNALVKGRAFKAWDYTVNGSQLRFRSVQTGQYAWLRKTDSTDVVEIVFSCVQYMEFPFSFSAITIEEPTADEVAAVRKRFPSEFSPRELYVLSNGVRRFYVVALRALAGLRVGDTSEVSESSALVRKRNKASEGRGPKMLPIRGITVEFGISSPWELGEELGDHPILATLIEIDEEVDPGSALFKLKSPVRHKGQEWTYIAASIRLEGYDFYEILLTGSVMCNCTGLSDESASNPESMYGQKWRGGGFAFIGSAILRP